MLATATCRIWKATTRAFGPADHGPFLRRRRELGARDRDRAHGADDVRARDQYVRQRQPGSLQRQCADPDWRRPPARGVRRAALVHAIENLGVVLFYDAARVWTTNPKDVGFQTPLSPAQFGPGIGLRYKTPLGPIRLDVAYRSSSFRIVPINVDTSEVINPPKGAAPPSTNRAATRSAPTAPPTARRRGPATRCRASTST